MSPRRSSSRGFTMVEVLVVVAIALVMTAIALPTITRSINSYQASGRLSNVDSILKRTRYESIRLNTVVNCLIQLQGNNWLMGADLNNNGTIETTEPQILLTPPFVLLPDGVAPGPATMGYPQAVNPANNPNFAIAFDPKGVLVNPATFVLYLGNPQQPEAGFRAVTLLPLGSTRLWATGANQPWHPQRF